VSAGAREVLEGARSLADFDASLRGPDHRLNPGTTADLVAATLLAALLSEVTLP
jgi:triphosphoribosyl-dephospho-CoA synthetase